MKKELGRRAFLAAGSAIALTSGTALASTGTPATKLVQLQHKPRTDEKLPFKISLAEWSLHRTLGAKKMTNLDFPKVARKDFDIGAIEYVNSFFKDKANDLRYLTDLKMRCEDHGVKSLLIMVDGEGQLGAPDDAQRAKAVENHHRWVIAAKFLGCHSIRVNAASRGTYDEQAKLAADGLAKLSEFAKPYGLNVIVENHGGLSSSGAWLSKVIASVNMDNCGTLPDFGNFWINRRENEQYDRYKGVTELMPFAKAVSAKSHNFDDKGNETGTDYMKMMKIVLDAGYRGYVGIEWEGGSMDEYAGIKATKALLERCQKAYAGMA